VKKASKDFAFVRVLLKLFFSIPFPRRTLYAIERLCALKQGKGWGAATISDEVDCCTMLLNRTPNVIIDIGANYGLYTDELLKRYPDSTYFLFEPSSLCYQRLIQKYTEFDNVNIFSEAVSDFAGTTPLYSNIEGSGLASLTKKTLIILE